MDVVARHLRARRRPARPLAARPRQRGPDREGRPRGARRVRHPRRQGHGRRQDRPRRSTGSTRSRRRTPRLFVGEFGDASAVDGINRAFASDLEKAGLFSLPITLIILVVAFGALVAAGIPLLLGADGRVRDVRPRRAAEPPAADRPGGIGDGAPDRARGRRRLLDVLPPAGARGAGRRAQRAAALEAAAATVRPLGARLRPDRDRRDGRHVPDRRRDVRVVRRRHDPRRRDGHARLADRAAGAALAARRQGRPGARPARRPASPRRTARAGSGARSSTASCGGPSSRSSSPAGCWSRSRVPALQLRMVQSGPETFPQDLAVVKTYNRMQDAFPGTGLPANVVVKAADVNAPAVRDAIDRLEAAGARERPGARADHRRRQRRRDGREHHASRSTGREPTARRSPPSAPSRRGRSADGGRAPGRRVRRHRRPGAVEGQHGPHEVDAAARGRVRARVRVRAHARRVPLDRRRGEGDRAEPALGRRGLRRAGDRLPARLRAGPARLRHDQRDRSGRAAAPVRDPVRPLDGLPRPHPQPDPGGLRPRSEHGRGDLGTGSSARPASSRARRS